MCKVNHKEVIIVLVVAVCLGSMNVMAEEIHDSIADTINKRVAALERRVEELTVKVGKLEQMIQLLQGKKIEDGTAFAAKELDYSKFKWLNITHWTVSNRNTGAIIGYEMKGEVTNETGKDFSLVFFNLTLYDISGKVIGSNSFMISGLRNGQTKPFDVTVYGVDSNKIWDWKLEYDRGY